MLDKETAQELSKELRIDLFTVYREYIQLIFLKHFYSQKNTEKIFFKGGTALRFLYGSFRFSEYLDFTSIATKIELENLINSTLPNLKKELGAIDFSEKKSIKDSFSSKIIYNLSDFKFPLTIRLDFSLREKPVLPDSKYIETTFPISPSPIIPCLDIKEMLAEKIRALIIRGQGRDIFDLWFLLTKKITLDWGLVNKKMDLYRMGVDKKRLLSSIQSMSDKEIKMDLARFLPLTHRKLVDNIKESTIKKIEESE